MAFFVYPLENYNTVKARCHPYRILEFDGVFGGKEPRKLFWWRRLRRPPFLFTSLILCLICLGFVLYLLRFAHMVVGWTAFAFTVVTLIDIVAMTCWRPIFWHAWIQIAMAAALFFFVSAGLLLRIPYILLAIWLFVGFLLNFITGVVFLIDVLVVLWLLKKRQKGVQPIEEEYAYREEPVRKVEAAPRPVQQAPPPRMTEEPPPPPPPAPPREMERVIVVPPPRPPRRPCACPPDQQRVRRPSPAGSTQTPGVPSYGGTFPVSKDLAPLSSSPPTACKQTCKGVCSPGAPGGTARDQRDQRVRSSQFPESRTVAVSTRMVPKSNNTRPHSTPAANTPRDNPNARRASRTDEDADIISQSQSSKKTQSPPPVVQPQPPPPSMISHYYVQNPCLCGKTHYAQATTFKGDISPCPPSPYYYSIQQETPVSMPKPKRESSVDSQTQRRNNGLDEREIVIAQQPQSLVTLCDLDTPNGSLETECVAVDSTIRACSTIEESPEYDCEEQEEYLDYEDCTNVNMMGGAGSICVPNLESVRICPSYQSTGGDHTKPCVCCPSYQKPKIPTCQNEACNTQLFEESTASYVRETYRVDPTDDGEVQTSETRIVRARDLEFLPKLPGAADRSPRRQSSGRMSPRSSR